MSDLSDFRAEFEQSAQKLIASVNSVSGLSSVEVEDKPIYTWNGQVVSATIYEATDNSIYYAEVCLLDSVKLITGSSPSQLRDIVFWLDKCLYRFAKDGAICILDMEFPAGAPF